MKHHRVSMLFGCFSINGILPIALCAVVPHVVAAAGKTYTSTNCRYTAMVADDRYIWAGTSGEGLLRIEKEGGATTLYTAANSGLVDNYIRALAFDTSGGLFAGTAQGGIAHFDGQHWKEVPWSGRGVQGLAVDRNDNLWVAAATQGSSVSRFDGNSWITVTDYCNGILTTESSSGAVWMYDRSRPAGSDCSAGTIYEYVNGGLQSAFSLATLCPETAYPWFFVADEKNRWIGGPDELVKVTGTDLIRIPVNRDTAHHKSITALAVNRNHVLLCAVTDDAGDCEVYLYDQVDSAATDPFDAPVAAITEDYVSTACADNMGNLWLGMGDGTIYKVGGATGAVARLSRSGNTVLPGNSVSSLLVDADDKVWVSTGGGMIMFDGGDRWTAFPAAGDSLPAGDVGYLALDSSGTVWAGFTQPMTSSMMQCGLACFNGKNWKNLNNGYYSINYVAVDREGDLWTVSGDGAYRHRGTDRELIFETIPSSDRRIALGTQVNAITFTHANTPLIGTGIGVKKYENGIWTDAAAINNAFPATTGGGMAGEVFVNALTVTSDSTLWVGTAAGLLHYSGDTAEWFDTTGGVLPDRNVRCLADDGNGGVLAGTGRGLVHFNGSNHTVYTCENSVLLDNEITTVGVAHSGELWVGTRAGGLTQLPKPGLPPISVAVRDPRLSRSRAVIRTHLYSRSLQLTATAALTADVQLSILTLQGQLVQRMQSSPVSGTVSFVWNGNGSTKQVVPRGMYLAVFSCGGRTLGSTRLLWY